MSKPKRYSTVRTINSNDIKQLNHSKHGLIVRIAGNELTVSFIKAEKQGFISLFDDGNFIGKFKRSKCYIRKETLDNSVQKISAFKTFNDLIVSCDCHNYVPTINGTCPDTYVVLDAMESYGLKYFRNGNIHVPNSEFNKMYSV